MEMVKVYFFGGKTAEEMVQCVSFGGKGANLAEMCK